MTLDPIDSLRVRQVRQAVSSTGCTVRIVESTGALIVERPGALCHLRFVDLQRLPAWALMPVAAPIPSHRRSVGRPLLNASPRSTAAQREKWRERNRARREGQAA